MPLTKYRVPVDIRRPFKSYRFDVYSLKAGRRMTLYGKPALSQYIELEADPTVTEICERPLVIKDSKPKRVVDFWALQGGDPTFYLLVTAGETRGAAKEKRAYVEFKKWVAEERAIVKEVSVDVFAQRRVLHENWATMLQDMVAHRGQVTPQLLAQCLPLLPDVFTIHQAEARLQHLDTMLARAIVYTLLAKGQLSCVNASTVHLCSATEFRRP